jgi:predicted negative regulator of RcsB-dependent stress response
MAEGYQTEDEQVEALKKWWRENGKSTLVSIVMALVAVFGWQGWQKQQQQSVDAASAIYQNLLSVAEASGGELTVEQQATAKHLANTLKTDFSGTTYALFAGLYQAKFAVTAGDLATAEQELHWVLDNKPTAELALQARLRLARVLYAQQKYDQALAQLGGSDSVLAAGFEELRGDIMLAQGNKDLAASAYQKALQLNMTSGNAVQNPILNMKLQQLDTQQQGSAVESVEQAAVTEGDA